jgi:N-glycosylase/DNA lyase
MRRYIDTYRLALELLELTEKKLENIRRSVSLDELWASMSFCILSSNVRLASANKAHRAICDAPTLFNPTAESDDLESRIHDILIQSGYRFHKTKARQLAKSWVALKVNHAKLVEMIAETNDIFAAREYIIKIFPGIGIKQASMFLRDIGTTCELAIIDIHIRRFLSSHCSEFDPSNKKAYLRAETWINEIAICHTSSVAAVDLAIWAAAKTLGRSRAC